MRKVGERAPDFQATDQRGREVRLATALERGPVVLFFYPKDFTPTCTKEACLFRDAYEELTDVAGEVIGVSLDGEDAHRRFADRYGLPFPLLSDQSKQISKSYGVLQIFGFMTKRVTFVIDAGGIIQGVFHHELSADRHVKEVRRALEELRPAG
jgi:peroxiredoxin Q/BCP